MIQIFYKIINKNEHMLIFFNKNKYSTTFFDWFGITYFFFHLSGDLHSKTEHETERLEFRTSEPIYIS
jgi:hypothetical protein